jgi:4-diphosphocytidyl-2-C-methyl-D-erythritol kinase
VKTAGRITFRTNAKVNLFLRVLGGRPDGFHELESVFHSIGLFDEIEIELTEARGLDVEFASLDPFSGPLPDPRDNSLIDAVAAMKRRGVDLPGLRVRVRKAIPLGSGLGGGSANAAGLLVALNDLCQLDLGKQELHAIAELVGSDVPVCLTGGAALVTGRGENVQPIPSAISIPLVLGLSAEPLSTAEVYDRLDEIDLVDATGAASMVHALGLGDPSEVASLVHNDLEPAALLIRPELRTAKEAMLEGGAIGACLSGSGPTIFGVARDWDATGGIVGYVEERFDRTVVVGTVDEGVAFL